MWKKLLNSDYFLLFGNDLEVCVTNYVSLWRLQFTEKSFLACLKDSNFGLEMCENELVKMGTQMLRNPERLKSVRYEEHGNNLIVTLTMSIGCPLRLQMKMTEGSKELFFSKITLQLLKTIQDLRASQLELRRLLHKKDLEIEEYKCEGGEIALRFLKTIPFNDESHVSQHTAYSKHFGSEDIPGCVLNKDVEVPEMRVMKTEPTVKVKQESPMHESVPTPIPSIKQENSIKKEEVTLKDTSLSNTDCRTQEQTSADELGESARTLSRSPSQAPPARRRPGTAPSPVKPQRKRLNL